MSAVGLGQEVMLIPYLWANLVASASHAVHLVCHSHGNSGMEDYIYIYAFSRCFYPKRLTVHSGYTFIFCQYVCSLGIEPIAFALLTQYSTTEPQELLHISSSPCWPAVVRWTLVFREWCWPVVCRTGQNEHFCYLTKDRERFRVTRCLPSPKEGRLHTLVRKNKIQVFWGKCQDKIKREQLHGEKNKWVKLSIEVKRTQMVVSLV